MKKNIAVIGCGHWGKNLVRNFSELGSLAAVCDPDIKLSSKYAKLHKVSDSSFEEILNNKDIQGVVIAAPVPLHASLGIEAMNAGKHVYIEKPLAMNNSEAKNMIKASKDNNVQLMVGHLLQYHPVFIELRKLINLNKLGKLHYLYSNRLSFGKIRSEEDVIWSFAPHDISMILSLINDDIQSIRCESSSSLQKDIADTAIIHMESKSGLNAHISVSWIHPYKEQKLVVIGKFATAVFDDTKPWNEKLALYQQEIDISSKPPALDQSEMQFIKVTESEPLKNECQHFIDVVDGKTKPLTDGVEGLKVLNILSGATLSDYKNSKRIEI